MLVSEEMIEKWMWKKDWFNYYKVVADDLKGMVHWPQRDGEVKTRICIFVLFYLLITHPAAQ